MNYFYKYASLLIDNTHRYFTNKKHAAVTLEDDYFDDKKYSPQEFYDYTKQFFESPELFFSEGDRPDFSEVKEMYTIEKNFYTRFAYPSPFKTKWEENNLACFDLFTKGKPSDTILLFAPGWARPNLVAEMGFAKKLLNRGIDTCLLTKPLHQVRTPAGYYSGELFISDRVFLSVMSFRQFVSEILFLIDYFKTKYKYVGMIGMSSGGFQSGIALNIKEVDFYFPLITGATLGSITWKGKLTKELKNNINKKGLDESDLNKVWAILDQVHLGHHCKARHIKQFISLYDQVVPVKFQQVLWEIYDKPEKYEMQCAHTTSFFYFSKIADEIARFVESKKNQSSPGFS
jgi:hypothetical protein